MLYSAALHVSYAPALRVVAWPDTASPLQLNCQPSQLWELW